MTDGADDSKPGARPNSDVNHERGGVVDGGFDDNKTGASSASDDNNMRGGGVVAIEEVGDVKCTYVKGVCAIHGEGARKFFKPLILKQEGPDGKVTRTVRKKAYYQCDLGQRGRGGRMRQPRISFLMKTTPTTTRDRDDNTVGYLGLDNGSVGQYVGIERAEQGNGMPNEK